MTREAALDAVRRICELPLAPSGLFRAFAEAPYAELRPLLAEDDLARFLAENPRCVEAWLGYSEDKRTTGGWYLLDPDASERLNGRREWAVGRFRAGLTREDVPFTDGPSACAAFILRELDDSHTHRERRNR